MAYNMKDQLAVGKLGEQVAIDYVKKSCELGRLSFESYEDVRSIKTYQEQDIDFLIHRKDGRTVTLDAKTDTYTTGNIFLEQAVDSYLFDEMVMSSTAILSPMSQRSITQMGGFIKTPTVSSITSQAPKCYMYFIE